MCKQEEKQESPEAKQCRGCLEARVEAAGCRIAVSVGDSLNT